MGLDLNSKVGLVKIATVLLLLSSVAAVLMGYFNASYISPGPDPLPYPRPPPPPGSPTPPPPAPYMTPEEKCIEDENAKPEDKRFTCPMTLMTLVAAIIIPIAFFASLIMLIVLLFVELPIFKMIDFIGHLVGGVLLLVAGILCIVYAIQSYIYTGGADCDYKCDDNPNLTTDKLKEHCRRQEVVCAHGHNTSVRQSLTFVFGGTFAILSGVAYIFAGILIKKQ